MVMAPSRAAEGSGQQAQSGASGAAASDRVRAHVGDLYQQMPGANLYRKAYEKGMSLTAFLEREDPTPKGEGLDAFNRMLKYADIKIGSDPENGYWADTFEAFDKDGERSRALAPEWMSRVARRVRYGQPPETRMLYMSDEFPLGSVARPYVDAAQARFFQLAPAIPLSEVVAITTPIDSDAYRAFYLTNDATQQRMFRVNEGAELPRARLTGGDHLIRLHKYGRALEITYEDIRRQRIDIVALHIARMAIQAEIDKLSAVLGVIVNGDGNTGTAATVFNLSSLDAGATIGTLSVKAWLAFKLKFVNPYAMTHAIANDDVVLQTFLLNMGGTNVPLVFLQGPGGMGGLTPINPGLADQVRIGHTTQAPASEIVAFDRRWGIERVTEVGGDITEVDRFITRQTQVLTISEVEGYAVFDQFAAKVLNLTA